MFKQENNDIDTIFQLKDKIFPVDEIFYKENVEETVILNKLRNSITQLETLKNTWEMLVIEGDIIEKSYLNIGNSGDGKLYSLFPAIFECKDAFRVKYKDNLDRMEKCMVEMAKRLVHLKERINIIEALINELKKINPPMTDVILAKQNVLGILLNVYDEINQLFQ